MLVFAASVPALMSAGNTSTARTQGLRGEEAVACSAQSIDNARRETLSMEIAYTD
jgi:hypothetical protein